MEEIFARTGLTLTEAFNTFIQQSLNVGGLPFLVTQNSKEMLREQAVAVLMMDLKKAEERAKQRIGEKKPGTDMKRAEAALHRALARIELSERTR